MDLRQIRSLAMLADVGGLTAAAQRLHVSPAAVHKQLRLLQSELGVQLYEHVGRKLVLTPVAEALLPQLRALLAQYDSVFDAVEEWKGLKRGAVRIGAGPTISTYVLPVLMKRFRRVHPNVELTVETGNTGILLSGLREGSLDLSLIVLADVIEASEFKIHASWPFELVLVSHTRQPHRRHSLKDLGRSPFILFQKGSRMEQPIEQYFAANGFAPRVVMRFDNAEAIKAMIRSGLGISVLPVWAVDSDIRQRRLHCIKLSDGPIVSRLALVSRNVGYMPEAAKAFAEAAQNIEWRNPRLSLR